MHLDIVTAHEMWPFHPNAVFGDDIFINEEDDEEIHTDLLQLFGF
jgi:hypothetical protein